MRAHPLTACAAGAIPMARGHRRGADAARRSPQGSGAPPELMRDGDGLLARAPGSVQRRMVRAAAPSPDRPSQATAADAAACRSRDRGTRTSDAATGFGKATKATAALPSDEGLVIGCPGRVKAKALRSERRLPRSDPLASPEPAQPRGPKAGSTGRWRDRDFGLRPTPCSGHAGFSVPR